MTTSSSDIDDFDLRILRALQKDASKSQRDIAAEVGLSQNACWRRLQRLEKVGLIKGTHVQIDLARLGLETTVFVMIRTRSHSKDWALAFTRHVRNLPEVVDFYRIGGEWDYMLKIVTSSLAGYDGFYQRLIEGFDFEKVSGFFAMEGILDGRPIDLMAVRSHRKD